MFNINWNTNQILEITGRNKEHCYDSAYAHIMLHDEYSFIPQFFKSYNRIRKINIKG